MDRRALLVALAASPTFGGVAFAQSADFRQNEQDIEAARRRRAVEQREQRRAEEELRENGRRQAAEEARRRGEPRRGEPRRGEPAWDRRNDRRYDDRRDRFDQHGREWRRDDRGAGPHDDRRDRFDQRFREWRRGDRGAGPDHDWYRGSRLPREYRSRQYVVDDWRGHRLNPPPRGYEWVQAGGDYLLVAIATGVIASILLNQ
jgi:Ni/Co efflux regulator RcnB